MVNFIWDNIFKRSERAKDLLHILGENYLFETLSKSELRFVKEMVHVRNYRPGEVVFRQGEIGVGMYLVASGSVDILVEDIPSDRPEKQTVFVTVSFHSSRKTAAAPPPPSPALRPRLLDFSSRTSLKSWNEILRPE
jgi:hypothetical protein